MISQQQKFKHKNKELELEVNTIQNALIGNCQTAIGWWSLLGRFIKSLPENERKAVKQHIFNTIDSIEEDLDLELAAMEQKYFGEENGN